MTTIIKWSVASLLVGMSGALASACAAQTAPEASSEPAGEAQEAVTAQVTCSTLCAGTGGATITRGCASTCSATATSVTCDGVTTYCTTPPKDSGTGVCSPGQFRSCCAYAGGCGCVGDQECGSNGQWGRCEGSTPRGSVCP